MGSKLREALKQQLAIIHERVEAKKLAKLALAELRELLAKEEQEKELEKELELGRKEMQARVKERVASRLREEEEKLEREELEKLAQRGTKAVDEEQEGRSLPEGRSPPEEEQEEQGRRKESKEKRKKGGKK